MRYLQVLHLQTEVNNIEYVLRMRLHDESHNAIIDNMDT